MLSARSSASSNPFRPALQHLLATSSSFTDQPRQYITPSLDSEEKRAGSKMPSARASPPIMPTTHFPQPPSQFPVRTSSAFQYADGGFTDAADSDDEEYDHWGNPASKRAFQSYERGTTEEEYTTLWRELMHDGGLGDWLFSTTFGWQVYIALLGLWLVGCSVGVVLLSRVIMWSGYLHDNWTSHTQLLTMIIGVYKFPYSLTLAFTGLFMAHGFLLMSACFTRFFSSWLLGAGLAGAVAPSLPLRLAHTPDGQRRKGGLFAALAEALSLGSGGIAGGGILEFEASTARQVLPLAVISVARIIATSYIFTYARIPDFYLSHVCVVPFAVICAAISSTAKKLVATLLPAVLATIGLAIASYRVNSHLAAESVMVGMLSSFLVALYPFQIHRTYRKLLEAMGPSSELLGNGHANGNNVPKPTNGDASGSREETRAYWRLLHYTSFLSIVIYLPILLLSGEPQHIWRNPYVIDIYFPRLTLLWVGVGSWAIFWSTMSLTRAASPLTAAFMFVPQATVLLCLTSKFRLPPGPWIGLGICWLAIACFVATRSRHAKRFASSGCC